MNLDEKAIQLITKLIRETSAGLIKWKVELPPKTLTTATEDDIHIYFEAEYKEKIIAIFERRSKYFMDEHIFAWTSEDVFAILDHLGNILIEYSQHSPVIKELFNTVRQQVADLDSLLNDLLD
ncbi:hypothetical protein [Acinetobacter calcoaceticus]|uniref:hypothetical protein n=1 Tax=Acinetobacter calcoaceticus TaxID=471 RepID=UPI003AF56A56